MLLSLFEEFLRSKRTGSSSSGLVVIDHEEHYLGYVRDHSKNRTAGKGWRQVRKVIEIGYSAASHENPLVQLSDLVTFILRKHAELAAGYREEWADDAKEFFTNCRNLLWERVLFKMLSLQHVSLPDQLVTYIKEVRVY